MQEQKSLFSAKEEVTPINNIFPKMLHGADYNPDQWLDYPDILEEDIRMMKLAKCNVMSVGIFSWVSLEPVEGTFQFNWMDALFDRFEANEIYAFLATPSGARPAWMSAKYPEVLRVGPNRVRNLHGLRHNHCLTSPVYREKVKIINRKLAERYTNHPAVIGWHISNEYGGECHCDLCQEEFRKWLKKKYSTLDELNHAWWTRFWSHTYTDWQQIESPAPHGETLVHGLNIDWKRFVTDQTVDFCQHEIYSLREAGSTLPVTTNLMYYYEGLNCWKFKDVLDIVSWDSYPTWHDGQNTAKQAARIAMMHDIFRSLKNRPFLLMESTPSLTNWQDVSKNKRPGMHLLSSLQAVAHGADSVLYFQWRKSRGSSEKHHGAVVGHVGHEHTRVFQDVREVGETLHRMDVIVGTVVNAETAVIFDWENRWAVNDSHGPRNIGIEYEKTVRSFYRPLWKRGIPVDVIDMEQDFAKYKLLIAPMLYMVRPGVGERIQAFVENGGIFVTTYWSGIVDENDLCFLGGFPGPLRQTLGIWSEEIDGLHDGDRNAVVMKDGNSLGFTGRFEIHELCELIHLEGSEALAVYEDDFYAGRPALTVNRLGRGKAYYLAARNKEPDFLDVWIGKLAADAGVRSALNTELPEGVTAQVRSDDLTDYVFIMNFSEEEKAVSLEGTKYRDLISDEPIGEVLSLPVYGVRVLTRARTEQPKNKRN